MTSRATGEELWSLTVCRRVKTQRLDEAKRGVAALNLLQARFHNNRAVRCTPQSVKVTAAARYAPNLDGLDLSSITVNAFVGLVTFLPLPDIKTLATKDRIPPTQNASSHFSGDHPLSKEILFYLRGLKAKEKAWGPENITTLDIVNNLGKLYAQQGKFVEAEKMYVRALSGFEKALRTSHDTTLEVSIDLQELHSSVATHGQ
ncbi:hypothetical protein PISL3812_06891 [Talaromyces islandicus]|uniref:Uncharacterized protein n=1 Tax=Talaromyces islandicus TaxID=28573 RepID=A0A0U1M391_TALIS|nr:hypothetical protein PISL3812_06891 [Talaromyces islandicus]